MEAYTGTLVATLATIALVALAAALVHPASPQPPPGAYIDARVYYDGVDTRVVVWHPKSCTVTGVALDGHRVYPAPNTIAERGETRDTYVATGTRPPHWVTIVEVNATCGDETITVQMVKRVAET